MVFFVNVDDVLHRSMEKILKSLCLCQKNVSASVNPVIFALWPNTIILMAPIETENCQHWKRNWESSAQRGKLCLQCSQIQKTQKHTDIQKYTYHYPWCTNWALSSQWEKERESLKRLFPTCFSWFWEKYVPINSIKREHIWTSQLIWLKVLFLFKPIRI